MKTVKDYRRAGYKVRVVHLREKKLVPIEAKPNGLVLCKAELKPKGGSTRIDVRHPDGREVFGYAYCNISDAYVKKEGVKLALERAVINFNED